MAWTEAELAYLAGIVDGEGCISLGSVRSSARSFTCQIHIGNTNARLIDWIHARFGGTVSLRKRQKVTHKPLWFWLLSGEPVGPLMTALLPYLVLKKEQAQLAIEYRATVQPTGHNRPISDHDIAVRHLLKSRLLRLNKRGAA